MRILVLDEEFPWPLNTGKRMRSFNLLSRIAAKHELYYLAYGETDSESSNALMKNRMNPIAVARKIPAKSGPMFYLRLLANLTSPWPYIVSSHYSRLYDKTVKEVIKEKRPDMIICEWTPYAVFVRDIDKIKKVIVAHNVETLIWKRYYENEKNPAKRWYIGIQRDKLERFENEAFGTVDGITAVSEIDAGSIREIKDRTPVNVVENGVDLDYFKSENNDTEPDSMVFVGTMDWRPNQDAVSYFAQEVFPLIRKNRPDAKVIFVGRKPPQEIKALNDIPGVTVTGSVDDVRPYMQKGAVYVVPLRIGGGTRLKILDAMAMKKAIVSTSVGAEGLEVSEDENILLADTAERFAEQIERLMDDAELRHRMGEDGRQLVEERYGWDRLAERLDAFLIELAGDK